MLAWAGTRSGIEDHFLQAFATQSHSVGMATPTQLSRWLSDSGDCCMQTGPTASTVIDNARLLPHRCACVTVTARSSRQ